jgi:hypothetical protein
MTRPPGAMTRLAVALLLAAAGALAWIASDETARQAQQHELAATLRAAPASPSAAWWRTSIARLVDPDAGRHEFTDAYWQGRYDAVSPAANESGGGPGLIGADAAFRRAQRAAGAQPVAPADLDRVLDAYAGALRNEGFTLDAAFNYEYVARLRDANAQAKPSKPRPVDTPAAAAGTTKDDPVGPTIHGRPGRHPPATRGNDFEVIAPMDFGDREAQPEPTLGVKLPRKG